MDIETINSIIADMQHNAASSHPDDMLQLQAEIESLTTKPAPSPEDIERELIAAIRRFYFASPS